MEIFFNCEGLDLTQEQIEYIKKTIATAALLHELPAHASVSITLVDEAEIREINRDYRNNDSVTDVISFALDEGEDFDIVGGGEEQLLGEIVVCLPRAAEQAEAYGHSLKRELCYLTAHGMLHLLGYDHLVETDKRLMREEEEKIMISLGLER